MKTGSTDMMTCMLLRLNVSRSRLMAADTVFGAAALLSFLLFLPMTSEPHVSYFCWVASGWKWLHVWFAWKIKQDGAETLSSWKLCWIKTACFNCSVPLLVWVWCTGCRTECSASAAPSLHISLLKILLVSLHLVLNNCITKLTLHLQILIHPWILSTSGRRHWSQVGLQTWLMWLRLTHSPRHQPSVWSQRWHKPKTKHTHYI